MADIRGRVPGPNDPDPENVRLRPFQGGTDSLPSPPTMDQTYGQLKYEDGSGPAADVHLPNGTGSGLSGLPQANAGTAPALWDSDNDVPGQFVHGPERKA